MNSNLSKHWNLPAHRWERTHLKADIVGLSDKWISLHCTFKARMLCCHVVLHQRYHTSMKVLLFTLLHPGTGGSKIGTSALAWCLCNRGVEAATHTGGETAFTTWQYNKLYVGGGETWRLLKDHYDHASIWVKTVKKAAWLLSVCPTSCPLYAKAQFSVYPQLFFCLRSMWC